MTKWTIRTALLGLILITAVGQAQVRDRVVGARGTPINGSVVATSPIEVSIEVNGVVQKIPVNELQLVQFAEEPGELRRVRDSLRNNNVMAATSEIKKIAGTTSNRALVQQEVEYYLAYCNVRVAMQGQGDKTKAGGELAKFVESYPKTYHYYEAVETLGNLATSLGNFNLAASFYGKMALAPWPLYQMRAEVLAARSLLAGQKFAEALQRYDKVMNSKLESLDAQQQKLLARVGRAACLGETGKAEEGLAIAREVIQKEDSQRDKVLFARAYNAMGRCYLKLNQPKPALRSFLHTDVLFHQDPDAHAEALYNLSKLWTLEKKSDRAIAARDLLKERYAGSAWASRQ